MEFSMNNLKQYIFSLFLFLILVSSFTLGNKQNVSCQFLSALQKLLNIHCSFVILNHNHLLSTDQNIHCNFITQWVDLNQSLCSSKNTQCLSGRRLFILDSMKNSQLEKIYFNKCKSNDFWIFLINESIEVNLTSIYLSVNCRYLTINQYQETYYLHEIFQFSNSSDIRNISLGYWNEKNGFSFQEFPSYYHNKDNFENSLINLCVFNLPPNMKMTKIPDNGTQYGGIYYLFWNDISESMNFRTIFIENEAANFGGPSENGTWSGIIGEVKRGNIDICSIIMQKKRLEAIDYLKPMSTDRFVLGIHHPGFSVGMNWQAYLLPFDFSSWITICITLILFTLIFKIIAWFWRNEFFPFSTIGYFLEIISSFCQQGFFDLGKLRTISGWTLMFTINLFSYLIYSFYSGSIISFLVNTKDILPYNNVEDIMNSKIYQIESPGGIMNAVIERSVDIHSTNRRMFKEFLIPLKNTREPSHLEGIQRLEFNPKYAFINLQGNFMAYFHNRNTKIVLFPFPIATQFIAFAMTKNHPYKKFIELKIQRMIETGITQRILSHVVKLKKAINTSSFVSADFYVILFPFGILIFGIILADIILLAEIITYSRFKRKILHPPLQNRKCRRPFRLRSLKEK